MRVKKFRNVVNLQIIVRKMKGSQYLRSASRYLELKEGDKIQEPEDLLKLLVKLLEENGVLEKSSKQTR